VSYAAQIGRSAFVRGAIARQALRQWVASPDAAILILVWTARCIPEILPAMVLALTGWLKREHGASFGLIP
jgi:hypothetical protein